MLPHSALESERSHQEATSNFLTDLLRGTQALATVYSFGVASSSINLCSGTRVWFTANPRRQASDPLPLGIRRCANHKHERVLRKLVWLSPHKQPHRVKKRASVADP